MHGLGRNDPGLILTLALTLAGVSRGVRAEDLRDAWAIALATNPQLQASRQTAESAGLELASSRSSRLPQLQTLNPQAFLTNPISVPSSSGQPRRRAAVRSSSRSRPSRPSCRSIAADGSGTRSPATAPS